MNRRSFIARLVGVVAAAALPFTVKPLPKYVMSGTVTGRWTQRILFTWVQNHTIQGATPIKYYFEVDLSKAEEWVVANLK